MAWTSPRTWAALEVPAAAQLNEQLRDNQGALSTHAHTGAAGDGAEIQGVALYGTGADGAVTISVNTTLTADMNYTDLTIDVGVVLSPDGYRIRCTGTLTINGTIRNNGANGSGSNGGAGGLGRGTLVSGGTGGTGNGGNATDYSTAGQGTSASINQGRAGAYAARRSPHGGAGGGAGGSTGAAGGGGGGPVFVAAPTIAGTGAIESKGGDGVNGGAHMGAGGGGGEVMSISNGAFPGGVTVTLTGGAEGGGAATAGLVGQHQHIDLSSATGG